MQLSEVSTQMIPGATITPAVEAKSGTATPAAKGGAAIADGRLVKRWRPAFRRKMQPLFSVACKQILRGGRGLLGHTGAENSMWITGINDHRAEIYYTEELYVGAQKHAWATASFSVRLSRLSEGDAISGRAVTTLVDAYVAQCNDVFQGREDEPEDCKVDYTCRSPTAQIDGYGPKGDPFFKHVNISTSVREDIVDCYSEGLYRFNVQMHLADAYHALRMIASTLTPDQRDKFNNRECNDVLDGSNVFERIAIMSETLNQVLEPDGGTKYWRPMKRARRHRA